MPKFRFRGFQIGEQVSVTATQGTSTDGRTVAEWGVPVDTPVTLALSATRVSGTAPMGVILTATATSPASRVEIPFHDIEYVWSFDDPGDFDMLDNAPIWGKDRNTAYGPHTTHVFETPGTYMVTCTAHDGENAAKSETITITVADPSVVFAGTNTAVVSTAGEFSDAPSGASTHTSIASARNALAGKQYQRLLLRRGESYTDQLNFDEDNGSGKRIHVGAFGTGDRPLFDQPGSDEYAIIFRVEEGVADELAVRDIDYVGEFDPTQTGQTALSGGFVTFTSGDIPRTAHKTIWGCHAKNSGNEAVNLSTGTDMRHSYIGNCWIDGWRNYGVLYSDGGYLGICGSKIKQPFGTRNGAGKNNSWADHGSLRVSRPTAPIALTNCDFGNFNDWATGSNYSMQDVTRWNSGVGAETADQAFVIDRMRCEGGPLNVTNQTTNTIKRDVYALVDRFYCVLTSHGAVTNDHGGTVYRNGIFVLPNIKAGVSTGIQGEGMWRDNASASSRRTEIYSCGFIDLRNNTNAKNRAQTSSVRDFALPVIATSTGFAGNNLGHCPNRPPNGDPTHDPVDTADGDWTPGYAGEAYQSNALDTSQAYGQETLATFKPATGSTAIGGASGKVSLIDLEGNLRSEVLDGLTRSDPSIGPYEPDLEG